MVAVVVTPILLMLSMMATANPVRTVCAVQIFMDGGGREKVHLQCYDFGDVNNRATGTLRLLHYVLWFKIHEGSVKISERETSA